MYIVNMADFTAAKVLRTNTYKGKRILQGHISNYCIMEEIKVIQHKLYDHNRPSVLSNFI